MKWCGKKRRSEKLEKRRSLNKQNYKMKCSEDIRHSFRDQIGNQCVPCQAWHSYNDVDCSVKAVDTSEGAQISVADNRTPHGQ